MLPINSLIDEIKLNCNKSKDNKYNKQSVTKSRFKSNWMTETEMEGSVATERTTVKSIANNQPQTTGKSEGPKHKRKQSANIPYKMSAPHTNISRL